MTPIDTIILHYETAAKEIKEQANTKNANSLEYAKLSGKAEGFEAAATFLKNLQKLFS